MEREVGRDSAMAGEPVLTSGATLSEVERHLGRKRLRRVTRRCVKGTKGRFRTRTAWQDWQGARRSSVSPVPPGSSRVRE